ncbi:hypothetical protein B0H17DRAFT_914354, partial [Mycena rosella]
MDTFNTRQKRCKENAKAYLKRKEKLKITPSDAQVRSANKSNAKQAKRFRYLRKVDTRCLGDAEFPPTPATDSDIHRILTNSSAAVQPDRFIESGCAVCGRLMPLSDLTPLTEYKGLLDKLRAEGVTRLERFTSSDPICEHDGPVLADGCTHLCIECEATLAKNRVPRHALANHGWLGQVPPALKNLTYAECIMIARVRHNRCVIRVNSGRVRMHANAIMFSQPALTVY